MAGLDPAIFGGRLRDLRVKPAKGSLLAINQPHRHSREARRADKRSAIRRLYGVGGRRVTLRSPALRYRSIVRGAAVDVDGLAGDEAAVLADEEQAGGGDLLDGALAAERDAGGVGDAAVVPLRVVAPCVDAAGRDDVDADVVRRELRGEAARQPDQPHLRRRDVGAAGAAAGEGAVADEEEDAAVAVLDHRPDQCAGEVEPGVEHDAAHPLPVFVGQLGEWLVRADRGIVDQDIDAAELGEGLRRQRLDLPALADIGDRGDGAHPERLRLAHDGLGLLPVGAGVDDDVRPFRRQFQYRRAADVAARSRDQRDLPVEPAHVFASPSVHSAAGRVRALSRSIALLAEATSPSREPRVTASAATAASFSRTFAMIASLARSKTPRLVATNSRDSRSFARWPLISGTT